MLIHKAKNYNSPETICGVKMAYNSSMEWVLVNCKKCIKTRGKNENKTRVRK